MVILLGEFKFISKKKKGKINIFRYGDELVNGAVINGSHIEIISNKSFTLEGCFGVVDYRDDYVKLKLKKGYVIICGKRLNITYYENETITLTGIIVSTEFCL